jgi:hypothetical protein
LDAGDTLGKVTAAAELLGDVCYAGEAEQAELRCLAVLVQLGEGRETLAEYELEGVGARW